MDLLLVGGGPRSVIQTSSDLVFMILYKKHFEELARFGAKYNIRTIIVEKQDKLGAGMAFSTSHTGMANTHVEDRMDFPLPFDSNDRNADLDWLLSYKNRYEKYFGGSRSEEYYNMLVKTNIPGAVMFKRSKSAMSATPNGVLDQGKAFLMRQSVGKEELDSFSRISDLASREIPFHKLEVKTSTIVKQILISTASKAAAVTESTQTAHERIYSTDVVRLNSGTPLVNPIDDLEVRKSTFCNAMNPADLKDFLKSKKMLDENEKLISGCKLISGGLSLSGLDQIAALSKMMDLFEEDEQSLLGYRVTEKAKQKYRGALALVSRTNGRTAVPRHSRTRHWKQRTPVAGSNQMIHALFLHDDGKGVLDTWYDILECAVARAVGSTPEAICHPVSTEEALKLQFEATEWHLECMRNAGVCESRGDIEGKELFVELATRTLYGAWRQASSSLLHGFGLEDKSDTVKVMEELAPLTWKGRCGYIFHRAQVAAVTNPKSASHISNDSAIQRLKDVMIHFAGSPVEVHSMFHLLFEAGIAKYVQAQYSDIRSHPDTNKLELRGELYDALVVSGVMSKDNDVALQSLKSSVATVEESGDECFPEVGKFRRLLNLDGTLVPVETNNLIGKGFTVKAESGGWSLLSSTAFDAHNRESVTSVTPSFTMRRMALAHLSAAGLDAHAVLDKIYEDMIPSEAAYTLEVQKFEEHFYEAHELWAYLKAIRKFCGNDPKVFSKLYDLGLTTNGRKASMQMMAESRSTERNDVYSEYMYHLSTVPKYCPPSRDEFFGRFVDATNDESARAYQKAVELSKAHLQTLEDTLLIERVGTIANLAVAASRKTIPPTEQTRVLLSSK